MLARLQALHPFQTPDAKRLAVLFGIVYFAQGMWYLPNQTITISLKDGGLSAGQVAAFFAITTVPWLIKPVYGLLSDFVPLFGYHRKSYLLLTSATAAAAGLFLGVTGDHAYWRMAAFFTLMALGLAFTDVLVDALMVENGKPMGLTGAFQSVQWGAITTASILVGELGGYLAENRRLHAAFFLAACFPLVSLLMAAFFVREAARAGGPRGLRDDLGRHPGGLARAGGLGRGRLHLLLDLQPVLRACAALLPDRPRSHFSQQFIGHLAALAAVAGVAGAFIYAPLSRRVPLTRLINFSIGVGVIGTLAYLVYRGPVSALVIDVVFGCVGMITQLAFLDLAAKSCPRRVEATFFALLMSVYNGGTQISQNIGGRLYDSFGYTPLVLISTAFTAAAWLLVPLVKIDRIEAKAKQAEVPAS